LPVSSPPQPSIRKAAGESASETESYSRFAFEPQHGSSIPPEQQLIAFLKIGIMLGAFQPGDKLPSVRQLEQQVGLGRNVIWRAYTKLAECGAITIEGRRRAIVNPSFGCEKASQLIAVCEWLAHDMLERVVSLRLNSQSFARFLNLRIQQSELLERDVIFVECNQLQALAWSKEISQVWDGLCVPGMDIESLRRMTQTERNQFRTVLTPLFHHDEVSVLFQDRHTRVLPLKLKWNSARIEELRAIPKSFRMAFILERSENLAYGKFFAKELNLLCLQLSIDVLDYQDSAQVKMVMDSKRYARALLSGRVLEAVDPAILNASKVIRDALGIDRQSLEEARVQAGIVL
jgi:DNA-binding transcriptional regulator YhcF (GntR family)